MISQQSPAGKSPAKRARSVVVSVCPARRSTPPGTERTSTIGEQKSANPLMTVADEDTFVRDLVASLGSYPTYFHRLGEVNRRGPALFDDAPPRLPDVDLDRFDRVLADGGVVIDVRPPAAFAAGYIPGSLSIPLRGQFATWLGWLVDDEVPLLFITDDGQDLAEIGWQAYKIGYERLTGRLAGGMAAWQDAGRAQSTLTFAPAERLGGRPYLDVRQESEYQAGHVPGALNVELGALSSEGDEVPDGVVVACGHGERAMTAASVLARQGHKDLAVLDGGPDDYQAAHP